MMDEWIEVLPWLGLFPMGFYLVMLYVAYRMPHARHGGFPLWIIGWLSLAYYVIATSTVRISIVLNAMSGDDTFRPWRFPVRFSGDLALMIFVLTLRMIFQNGERTLWDDISTDANRMASGVRHLVARLRGKRHED